MISKVETATASPVEGEGSPALESRDRLPQILISSHLSRHAPPPQCLLVQRNLRQDGYTCRMVGKGESGAARFLDVLLRGIFETPRADTVLVDVFGHRAFIYETISMLYAKICGRRIVVMLRGGWLPEFVESWPIAKRILAWADQRIAPHAFLAEALTRQGIQIDQVIPNFINLDNYTYRARETLKPNLLYLRGTAWIYDPESTLRAFGLVQQRYPEAQLTFAGSGSLTEVRALADELELRNVDFVGLVPKEQISELASRHDIYLQSNVSENMPVTILEMWACGVPVVCTDVGGTPYMVTDGVDGLILPIKKPEALAAACCRLLEDPALASRLARAGHDNVQEFTWETVGRKWREVLAN